MTGWFHYLISSQLSVKWMSDSKSAPQITLESCRIKKVGKCHWPNLTSVDLSWPQLTCVGPNDLWKAWVLLGTTCPHSYPAPGWRSQPPSPWWRGGGKMTPPITRKSGTLEGRTIRRSKALIEPVRSSFGHLFVQVNIEVSRGHERSNFRKMMVLSWMSAIISGTIIATPNPRKKKIAHETLR